MIAKLLLTGFFTTLGYSQVIAQSLVVEEGQILSVTNEATLTIPQSIVNNGFLINQGIIQLAENWVSQSSYSGNGCVELVGSGEQVIQHDGQNFGTLKIENEGRKVLESSIIITDTLTLNNGVLVSSQSRLLQLGAESVIENASNLSYVQGPIQFEGTGYRYLPTGTQNTFLPLEFLDVQGVNPVLFVEVIDEQAFPVRGERLEEKESNKYWNLEIVSGTYEGSIVGLPVSIDDDFDDLLGVVVAQSDEINGDFSNLGQNDRRGGPDNGYVSSEMVATGPIITLGLTTDYAIDNSVEIPSAFAPDAANPTDREIKVYAANLLTGGFSFTIFNRWGQIVYQTRELTEATTIGWDGVDQNSNEPAPAGVYSYVLRGRYETNQVVEKTGSITLFR